MSVILDDFCACREWKVTAAVWISDFSELQKKLEKSNGEQQRAESATPFYHSYQTNENIFGVLIS